MAENVENRRTEHFSFTRFIVRVIVGAVVLFITQAVTLGFRISGVWTLLLAAVVLAVLDYLVEKLLGMDATPFGRGLSGFILAAVIIYVIQFIVPGYSVTLIGAILGALIYGLVDMIVPGRTM